MLGTLDIWDIDLSMCLCSQFKAFPDHCDTGTSQRAEEMLRNAGAGKFAEMVVARANVSFSSKPASSSLSRSHPC